MPPKLEMSMSRYFKPLVYSSFGEMVTDLKALYTDRRAARARADQGKIFIRTERTWRDFAESFIDAAS